MAAAFALWSCDDEPSGPPCPAGTGRDPQRLTGLVRRLAEDPDARALTVATTGRYVACFGEGIEPGIDDRHRLRLDAQQSEERLAAKLGHLLLHVSRGLPYEPDDARPCATRLAQARERETEAHALESSLLRRYGLAPLGDEALEQVMAGYASRCGASSSK